MARQCEHEYTVQGRYIRDWVWLWCLACRKDVAWARTGEADLVRELWARPIYAREEGERDDDRGQ